MSKKIWVLFACLQATGIWCIHSGGGELRILVGWWVFLFPGCVAALPLPLDYGIPAEIAVSVAVNAVIWYSISRLIRHRPWGRSSNQAQ
jgi:hypothetical protein